MTKKTVLVMMAGMALVVGTVMMSGCLHTISVTSATKTGSNLQIVSFNQDLTTLEVLQRMDKVWLKPANLEEVMKEPKRATANGGLIFALGSSGVLPGDARVCYTVPGCPDRDPIMYINSHDVLWPRIQVAGGHQFWRPAQVNVNALNRTVGGFFFWR